MTHSDYLAQADLYLGRDWASAAAQGPRGFRSAARALRFAFEHAAPVSLRGARLTVGAKSFSGEQLAALYRNPAYPLRRKV
ncbi:MAG TPA: hypothetical protein VFE64_09630 [Devosia sp.]|jgi:hypothetical protein|nr:hypothetical protein [Devosia sp.]